MKILSGGQTGVDRAALDVALALGVPCGGWCPQGRRAEDGPIAPHYPLTETESPEYEDRTERNVVDADATLILTRGQLHGGTNLTARMARRHGRPLLVVDPDDPDAVATIGTWLRRLRVATLNVAGPRESNAPGIYADARRCLEAALPLADPG